MSSFTSGVGVYLEYGKQVDYKTALGAGAANRLFGLQQRLESLSVDESVIPLSQLNGAEVAKFAYGGMKGKIGVGFVVSNPWFLDGVLGTPTTTGTGPYTHTYKAAKTANVYTIEAGFNLGTDRVLLGSRSVVESFSLTATPGAPVEGKLDFNVGAFNATGAGTLDSSVATDGIDTPYTFESGFIFQNPSGTAVAEIQSTNLKINTGIEVYPEPNSPYPGAAVRGRTTYEGDFSILAKDNTWWNNVRARAEPANNTLAFKLTNGLAGTSERTITFVLTGLGLKSLDVAVEQDRAVQDKVSFIARTCTATAVNNTAASP